MQQYKAAVETLPVVIWLASLTYSSGDQRMTVGSSEVSQLTALFCFRKMYWLDVIICSIWSGKSEFPPPEARYQTKKVKLRTNITQPQHPSLAALHINRQKDVVKYCNRNRVSLKQSYTVQSNIQLWICCYGGFMCKYHVMCFHELVLLTANLVRTSSVITAWLAGLEHIMSSDFQFSR